MTAHYKGGKVSRSFLYRVLSTLSLVLLNRAILVYHITLLDEIKSRIYIYMVLIPYIMI